MQEQYHSLKKNMVLQYIFVKIHKVFKANTLMDSQMLLLEVLLFWNFHNKKCIQFSLTLFGTAK